MDPCKASGGGPDLGPGRGPGRGPDLGPGRGPGRGPGALNRRAPCAAPAHTRPSFTCTCSQQKFLRVRKEKSCTGYIFCNSRGYNH